LNILIVHQNFPGQFKHLAPALAAQGHQVVAFSTRNHEAKLWKGVKVIPYTIKRGSGRDIHPWVSDFESKVIRAEAAFQHALSLRQKGFVPDVILAHPGWGESLFLNEVWPQAKLAIYAEYFYQSNGGDVGFDPEFARESAGDACRLRIKNLNYSLHFQTAEAGLSPTQWQASTFPPEFQKKIRVIHDGINTDVVKPDPQARYVVSPQLSLSRQDEVVTFVNRNLEPYRGYHVFMRGLPQLLQQRPKAHVVVVGGDEVSYGSAPKNGTSWKQIFIDEVRPHINDADWSRVHFVGKLPYEGYMALMQVSSVHVYLTYPFVLSWSLLEAMAMGAAIVASDTAPVAEVIEHGVNGLRVPFFDVLQWVSTIADLLDNPAMRERLGQQARQTIVQNYDLHSVCLPQQLAWVNGLGPSLPPPLPRPATAP
jgi:glycosyltransferase involved in cell wall biosynthesis